MPSSTCSRPAGWSWCGTGSISRSFRLRRRAPKWSRRCSPSSPSGERWRRRGIRTSSPLSPACRRCPRGASCTSAAGRSSRCSAILAERSGIADRAEWAGALARPEVLARLRTADIFVLASRIARDGDRDGLPNVLLEAQSQGLPCVATRVSAIPELIDDEATGVLSPPGDSAALAVAIERLLEDPDLRRRLGTAGERRVRAEFSSVAGADRLAAKFRGLLGPNTRGERIGPLVPGAAGAPGARCADAMAAAAASAAGPLPRVDEAVAAPGSAGDLAKGAGPADGAA